MTTPSTFNTSGGTLLLPPLRLEGVLCSGPKALVRPAAILACVFLLLCATVFVIDDRYPHTWIIPSLTMAFCLGLLVQHFCRTDRLLRRELLRLLNHTRPLSPADAATAAWIDARINSPRQNGIRVSLYRSLTDQPLPTLIAFGVRPPPHNMLELPGETVPIKRARSISIVLWMVIVTQMLAAGMSLYSNSRGDSQSGWFPPYLHALVALISVGLIIFTQHTLPQARFIGPGILSNDAGARHVIATTADATLLLEPVIGGVGVSVWSEMHGGQVLTCKRDAQVLADLVTRWQSGGPLETD